MHHQREVEDLHTLQVQTVAQEMEDDLQELAVTETKVVIHPLKEMQVEEHLTKAEPAAGPSRSEEASVAVSELRRVLLSTGDQLIAEAAKNDRNWGIGLDVKQPEVARPEVARLPERRALGRGQERLGGRLGGVCLAHLFCGRADAARAGGVDDARAAALCGGCDAG